MKLVAVVRCLKDFDITIIFQSVLLYVGAFMAVFFTLTTGSPFIGSPLDLTRRFEISQKSCQGSIRLGKSVPGVCMFNFQCHQSGGEVIGTCIDGFLFGACCRLTSEALESLIKENEMLNDGNSPSNEIPESLPQLHYSSPMDKLSSNSATTVKATKILSTQKPTVAPKISTTSSVVLEEEHSSTKIVNKNGITTSSILNKYETSNLTTRLQESSTISNSNATTNFPTDQNVIDWIMIASSNASKENNESLVTSSSKIKIDETKNSINSMINTRLKSTTVPTTIWSSSHRPSMLRPFLTTEPTGITIEGNETDILTTTEQLKTSVTNTKVPLPFNLSTSLDKYATWTTKTRVPISSGTHQYVNSASLILKPQRNISIEVTSETLTTMPIKEEILISQTENSIITTEMAETQSILSTKPMSITVATKVSSETTTSKRKPTSKTATTFKPTIKKKTTTRLKPLTKFKPVTKPIPVTIPMETESEISTITTNKVKPTTRPLLVPVNKTSTMTSQEALLFWTTRRPPTRTPPPALHNLFTSPPLTTIPTKTSSENPYDIAMTHISNNLLHDNTDDQEEVTTSWGMSTYPILFSTTKKDTQSAEVYDEHVLPSGIKYQVPKQTSSTSEKIKNTEMKTTTEVGPPLDINLLVQLLNLTSYIPEAGVFIPSNNMTTTENEIEIPPEIHRVPDLTSTSTTTTTSTAAPTIDTATTTTSTTTPRSTTTTTATTSSTTTIKKWNWKKTCGVRPLVVREARIVNGRKSIFGEWPWQALIRESTWLGIFTKNKCGGVLLNSKYVLTAAHCQPGFLASLIVVLGEQDVSGDYEPKKTIQRNVKRVVVHKDFIARTFDNDLALLEMDSPVKFDEHIIPICMPQGRDLYVGTVGYVSGWGRLSYQGSIPNLLHNVQVPVIPNNECQSWFREAGHSKVIKPEFICAGYKNGQKDSCEGDSGGPLSILGEDGRWILAGIVSHGIKCAYANLPGVYMRMTYYKPWIDNIINS